MAKELTDKQKKYREREAVPIRQRNNLSVGKTKKAERDEKKNTRQYNRRARKHGFATAQQMYDWMRIQMEKQKRLS